MEDTPLKCVARYDGTNFAGWQRQTGMRTVQGVLEETLSRIARREIAIQGAGRTDAGVHALGQVFSCRWPDEPPQRLGYAVSKMTGPEIRIESVLRAPPTFNARFDALGKRYVYTFDFNRRPDPFSARYAWHVPYALDLELFEKSLRAIRGIHDFAGFQSAGNQMKHTVRAIHAARLYEGGLYHAPDANGLFRVELVGDGFLYKMVRNICGTLVEIARGRFAADTMQAMLRLGGPFRGHCAPAHGLALAEVYYDACDFDVACSSP